MNSAARDLRDAFREDHRVLARGFSRLLKAIETDEMEVAARTAEELDRCVGAHIQFEEEVFYPEIAKIKGTPFVKQLRREHRIGLGVVERLRQLDLRGETSCPEERSMLADQARMTLDHVAGCGTLLSHVTTLDQERCARMLTKLLDLRHDARRWSELET